MAGYSPFGTAPDDGNPWEAAAGSSSGNLLEADDATKDQAFEEWLRRQGNPHPSKFVKKYQEYYGDLPPTGYEAPGPGGKLYWGGSGFLTEGEWRAVDPIHKIGDYTPGVPDSYHDRYRRLLDREYNYNDPNVQSARSNYDQIIAGLQDRMGNLYSTDAARQAAVDAANRQRQMAMSGPGYNSAALRQGEWNAGNSWQSMQPGLAAAEAQERQGLEAARMQALMQRQGLESSYGLGTAENEQKYRMALEQMGMDTLNRGYDFSRQSWENELEKARLQSGLTLANYKNQLRDEARDQAMLGTGINAIGSGVGMASSYWK